MIGGVYSGWALIQGVLNLYGKKVFYKNNRLEESTFFTDIYDAIITLVQIIL